MICIWEKFKREKQEEKRISWLEQVLIKHLLKSITSYTDK